MSFELALQRARETFLRIPGVVGVSNLGNTIIVYVETEEVARRIPGVFMGFPVVVRVVGRVGLIR